MHTTWEWLGKILTLLDAESDIKFPTIVLSLFKRVHKIFKNNPTPLCIYD